MKTVFSAFAVAACEDGTVLQHRLKY